MRRCPVMRRGAAGVLLFWLQIAEASKNRSDGSEMLGWHNYPPLRSKSMRGALKSLVGAYIGVGGVADCGFDLFGSDFEGGRRAEDRVGRRFPA